MPNTEQLPFKVPFEASEVEHLTLRNVLHKDNASYHWVPFIWVLAAHYYQQCQYGSYNNVAIILLLFSEDPEALYGDKSLQEYAAFRNYVECFDFLLVMMMTFLT
jgi:hypothetical protein